MCMGKKEKINKLLNYTVNFLIELSKFSDEIITPLTLSGMRKNLNFYHYDNRKFDNHVRSLERRGYIIVDRKNDSVRLTNKGKIKLIERVGDFKLDGKWRMISFDVPEKLRVKRDQFRRSIKRVGFKQVQKSLWACPFVHADQVDLIISELDLKDFVAYLRVDKTDIENHLLTQFKG